jgi:TetR/AcrR family transcriptional repressor of nem operon
MLRLAPDSRNRLLDAALKVIRTKGYSATRVEEICAAAGLSKGSFFHHFESKEALAVAAAEYWSQITGELFLAAKYHTLDDPLARLLAYLDFRRSLVHGDLPEWTCLVGTMAQETYTTVPEIREACDRSIRGHADTLVADITAAKKLHAPDADWSPKSLALHTQVVLQGAFVVAKAHGDARVATDAIDHLRRYFELLFPIPRTHSKSKSKNKRKKKSR